MTILAVPRRFLVGSSMSVVEHISASCAAQRDFSVRPTSDVRDIRGRRTPNDGNDEEADCCSEAWDGQNRSSADE